MKLSTAKKVNRALCDELENCYNEADECELVIDNALRDLKSGKLSKSEYDFKCEFWGKRLKSVEEKIKDLLSIQSKRS